MKIALVVPGRFHAFDLARALLGRGHEVTVLTNYPAWAAARFGVPRDRVRSYPVHGVLSRAVNRVGPPAVQEWFHPVGLQMFGRWAAGRVAAEPWDVVHCWSGVSEELLATRAAGDAMTLLMRGSSHIVTQRRLLADESARVSVVLDRPSDWIVAREQREYDLVDRIAVLSTFAERSFEAEGVPRERLRLLPLGVDVDAFKAPPEVIDARRQRIRDGAPLHVLFAGAVSYRKGLRDLADAIAAVAGDGFRFTLAGEITREARDAVTRLGPAVQVLGKVPQDSLPGVYRDADVFLFPTIEDGFALVLAQAKAAGLPIITTPNSAGPDLLTHGRDGWVVPIRDAGALVEQLRWCDANRGDLAEMVSRVNASRLRSWSDVAADFEQVSARRPRMPAEKVHRHAC